MTDPDTKSTSATEPLDPSSPLFRDEGDINDDRQDPPTPQKVDGESDELDGTTATPGDDASDQ